MVRSVVRAGWTWLLLFALVMVPCAFQPKAHGNADLEPIGKIQGFAIGHETSSKYAKADSLYIMGAFATSDDPTTLTQSIPLKFDYKVFDKFYVGVAITNDSGNDYDVTVTFEISGPRNGKEEDYFTIPADSTYYAYIYDSQSRPGFYSYKMAVEKAGSAKIKLQFSE